MNKLLIDVQRANVNLRHDRLFHQVLHDITFQLYANKHCALLGSNGSGKSTFLRFLRGEVWIDVNNGNNNQNNGYIHWYFDQNIETSPIMGRRLCELISAAKQQAYIKHQWSLNGEDILLTAFSDSQLLFFIPEPEQREAVKNMAEKLLATHLLSKIACNLSQGELRLLLIGRALLRQTKVLLLDECMDGLDIKHREHIHDILQNCGATIIFTDHRPQGIPHWVKHVYKLEQGHLTLNDNSKPYPTLTKEIAPSNNHNEFNSNENDVFIKIKDATVYIDRKVILHDISWTWRKGEHWLLQGENGSGKSTFLRLLAAQEYVAWGGMLERFIFHKEHKRYEKINDLESIKAHIALLSHREEQSYAYDVTGLELVLSGFESVAGIYRNYSEEEYAKAEQMLINFKVQHLAKRRIRSLSTGQLRTLFLARLLINKPQLLLLDEPFSGLDYNSRMAMHSILEELCQQKNDPVHIVLTSHYVEDGFDCLNRTAIMQNQSLRKC